MHEPPEHSPAPGTFTRTSGDPWSPAQRRAGLGAILLLIALGFWTLRAFLPSLGWAVILAISLWPWRERAIAFWPGGARLAWPGLFTLAVGLFFVLPLALVAHAIVVDGQFVLGWIRDVRAHGLTMPEIMLRTPYGAQIAPWWQEHLATPEAIGHLRLATATGGSTFYTTEHLLGLIVRRLVQGVFLLLILFFLLRDGERLADSLRQGCERGFGVAGEHVAMQALQAVRGTVNGLVVVGFFEGVLLGVVYALFGTPHAALLGVTTGLLSAVPFGAVLAAAVAAILLAAAGKMVAAAVVGIFAAVVIFVADHFVRPVMIGDATQLPFLLVLLGILGGIEVWGLIGLVAGPALMAVLMLLWREWIGSQQGPLNPPANHHA